MNDTKIEVTDEETQKSGRKQTTVLTPKMVVNGKHGRLNQGLTIIKPGHV